MTTKIKCWGILWHVPAFSSALFSTHFSLFCFSPFCSFILCKWAAFTSPVLREECSTEIKKIQWNWEAGYLFSLSFPYSIYCSSSHLSHFQGSLLLPSPAGRELGLTPALCWAQLAEQDSPFPSICRQGGLQIWYKEKYLCLLPSLAIFMHSANKEEALQL